MAVIADAALVLDHLFYPYVFSSFFETILYIRATIGKVNNNIKWDRAFLRKCDNALYPRLDSMHRRPVARVTSRVMVEHESMHSESRLICSHSASPPLHLCSHAQAPPQGDSQYHQYKRCPYQDHHREPHAGKYHAAAQRAYS